MAATLAEQLSLDPLTPDTFTSHFLPDRMGNSAPIAYGGCTIGVAISAASRTVAPQYRLYSAMGNYLGPALTNRPLKCTVRRVRDTRTFATRLVEVSQELDSEQAKQDRLCLILLADFQTTEPASLLTYSAPPMRNYSPPDQSPDPKTAGDDLVRRGAAPRALVDMHASMFGLMARFFESRQVPEGVSAHNLAGLAKSAPTPQDGIPLTEKTSADWFRVRHPLRNRDERVGGLAFVMDGALSFLPLTHSGLFFDDVAACSSLDFAMRVFVDDAELDLEKWHLREMWTVTGGGGRTYSESRLWDQEGRLVANMTQQSILRPKGAPKAAL